MGLFDFFKKKDKQPKSPDVSVKNVSIPESEKKYYQPDDYYTDIVAEGTTFEHRVVTFEERKKTAIPSLRGLYPAEILLLEYCSKGTYPHPKNGYPSFWWFTYGIRDVGAVLKTLADREFIVFAPLRSCIRSLTVSQLKDMLIHHEQKTTGKKDELVERLSSVVSDEELIEAGLEQKYMLTEKGMAELAENEYVPYMHNIHSKTTEDSRFGMTFNVWSVNKLLGSGDKSNWKDVVDEQEHKMNQEASERHNALLDDIIEIDSQLFNELKKQDEQLASIKQAQAQYMADKDLDKYIDFWERLWENGGLEFCGSKWHFELPDLYIKAKRYDDAVTIVMKLKKDPLYATKAESYIKRIENLKMKQNKNK